MWNTGFIRRGLVDIWGWAWAAAGIVLVDVSVDGGRSWSAAEIEPRREWSSQRFTFAWQPPSRGSFVIAARATDMHGAAQTKERARNAVHSVPVKVD
jgi:hypothetical protein